MKGREQGRLRKGKRQREKGRENWTKVKCKKDEWKRTSKTKER